MKKKDENITTKGNTRVTYKCIYQHMITYKYPITLFFFLRSTNVRAPYDVVASDLHCSVTKVLVRATYASIWKEEESSFQSNVMIFRSERLFWWKLIFDNFICKQIQLRLRAHKAFVDWVVIRRQPYVAREYLYNTCMHSCALVCYLYFNADFKDFLVLT